MMISAPAAAQSPIGDWQGTLDVGGARLRLVLHIAQNGEGGLTGTIEDMLITLTDQIHLVKLVGPNTFLYLAVDKKQSNIAMVRSAVNKHANALVA